MAQDQPIIETRDLVKRFGEVAALDGITLTINNGEFLTLLGPSGCGKTTLLRIIAGFETPTSGAVTLNGHPTVGIPPNQREVNTVFQSYALFPHMTVYDNIAFGLRRKKLAEEEIGRRIAEVLTLVNLEGLDRRKPYQLSGGQQQRVALARAVVNRPLVLLLDEPLSALDHKLRTRMQLELKHLQRRLGITFIYVTHDQEEAFVMSDRVAVMGQGKITQLGTPQEVYENPENLFVAGFVGEINILDAVITSPTGESLVGRIEGREFPLASKRAFSSGDRVKVLLRPEDLRLTRVGEIDAQTPPGFRGVVMESSYKGATVTILVELSGGTIVQVTEFFNEDDEVIDYRPGEEVLVEWVNGWETVLPDE